jgi:hypothetical protein
VLVGAFVHIPRSICELDSAQFKLLCPRTEEGIELHPECVRVTSALFKFETMDYAGAATKLAGWESRATIEGAPPAFDARR